MTRVLDPYHRIRATVGAIFVLSVVVMALVTTHGPGRRAVSGAVVTVPAPAAAQPVAVPAATVDAPAATVAVPAATVAAGSVGRGGAAAHPRTPAARTLSSH
jgi:hypothetical protein